MFKLELEIIDMLIIANIFLISTYIIIDNNKHNFILLFFHVIIENKVSHSFKITVIECIFYVIKCQYTLIKKSQISQK